MKYSFYATEDTLCEFECIREYITEYRKVKGLSVAKISFNDDKFYNELKKYNPNVKYTRFEKYGHKAAGIFAKRFNWTNWLFRQRKDN